MAKGKVESEKKGNWGEFGGNEHMFGFRGTGKQEPGQTAQEGTGSKGASASNVRAEGGGNKAFVSSGAHNEHGAGPQEPGQSCSAGKRQEGFAHGGSTHMWGNRGSRKAVEGQSGPNG